MPLFSNDLRVTFSPDLVTFRCGDQECPLRPRIYIDRDTAGFRVVAVDPNDMAAIPAVEVKLFDPVASLQHQGAAIKGDCLAAFFRYGVAKVSTFSFVRPRIFLFCLETLEPIFSGYQGWIMREIGKQARARAVYIVPPGGTYEQSVLAVRVLSRRPVRR